MVTFIVIQKSDSVKPTPILKPLSDFPEQIGDWKKIDSHDLSENISDMLGVTDYISFNYISPKGSLINLYISYFDAVGVTGSYHSPLNCLPGGGVKIMNTKIIELHKNRDKIKKLTLSHSGSHSYGYYWYYNRGRVIYSEYLEKIYLVLDAVFKGRRDGSFIRVVSYPNHEGESNTEDTMIFINKINELSAQFIPGSEVNGKNN